MLLKSGKSRAALEQLVSQIIKGMDRVEYKYTQYRQHLQPVEIVQTSGLAPAPFRL